MRPAGEVVRSAQGLAVLQVDDDASPPDLGAPVVDEQLTEVGRVVDVFGPVDRPYVAVSPNEDVQVAPLVGTRLYERDD